METGSDWAFRQRHRHYIRLHRILLFFLASDQEGHAKGHELGLLGVGYRNDILHLLVPDPREEILSRPCSRIRFVGWTAIHMRHV